MACLCRVASHDILDGACSDVAVVRQARGEGRTIVESVGLAALREPELFMEGIDLLPVREYLLFLRWELDLLSNFRKV